jgi:hypothetical protein
LFQNELRRSQQQQLQVVHKIQQQRGVILQIGHEVARAQKLAQTDRFYAIRAAAAKAQAQLLT